MAGEGVRWVGTSEAFLSRSGCRAQPTRAAANNLRQIRRDERLEQDVKRQARVAALTSADAAWSGTRIQHRSIIHSLRQWTKSGVCGPLRPPLVWRSRNRSVCRRRRCVLCACLRWARTRISKGLSREPLLNLRSSMSMGFGGSGMPSLRILVHAQALSHETACADTGQGDCMQNVKTPGAIMRTLRMLRACQDGPSQKRGPALARRFGSVCGRRLTTQDGSD